MSSGPTSWRYGSQHRRLCARAGCGAQAVATLRFESTERQAWLVELDDNAARTQGDLCKRHATALVLPRGWELHDDRGSATPTVDDQPVPSEGIAPKGSQAGTDTPRAAGNGTASPGALLPVAAGDDEVEEALDAVLDARTPLLRRAFRNARPSES